MKFTKTGTDFITISEDNLKDNNLLSISKIHIIKLDFNEPTREKVNEVMMLYPKTNRYVISRFIRIYNSILKNTAKKYYVENNITDSFISFMRKNNKILFNINKLNDHDRKFVLSDNIIIDLLKNVEVVQLRQEHFDMFEHIFINWNGNVIIE